MAAFPPLPQIVGKHGGTYEAYFLQADPLGSGSIGALDAANFLRKSKLPDTTLSQVWDLSDPMGKGYLEKTGFFVALKLIALVQNSQDLSVAKISLETPPPNLGPVEPVDTTTQASVSANVPWDIPPSEKSKYDQVFDSLKPAQNKLAGEQVRPVLMNSKLAVDVLGRIWELSDIDKDGYLDRDEFAVAMHLVYQAREGQEIPQILKPGLIPPSKRKGAGLASSSSPMPGAVPVLPVIGAATMQGINLGRSTPTQGTLAGPSSVAWVVTAAEKASSDAIFKTLDTDMDGLVSGIETRDVMAQSRLPTTVLAHIWGLCDSNSLGKLTADQFALAMHLIQQKLAGIEPPAQLSPEMIPPSLRAVADPGAFGVRDGTNAGPYSHVADFSTIKDLDKLSQEIEEIKKEKLQLERDKVQQEADLKLRQSEVLMLQKELDGLNSTLTQLDSQKKEAQRRLDELTDKRSNLERNVQELRTETDKEQMEVNKMKSLLSNREQIIKDQEKELEKLRLELTQLRDEESRLEQNTESSRAQLEQLSRSQSNIGQEISVTKSKLDELQAEYRTIDPTMTPISSSIDPITNGSSFGSTSSAAVTNARGIGDFQEDPFKSGGMGSSLPDPDPFQNDDPFKGSDPFKSADPFGSEDPFKDAFGNSNSAQSDPFGNVDPFGGLSAQTSSGGFEANFDAFGSSWSAPASTNKIESSQKSSDPFSSPSRPSQPPKQKKAPPPRPAPPKSKSPTPFKQSSLAVSPSKPKVDPFSSGFGSDPFGGNDPFSNTGGKTNTSKGTADPFANFADFSPGKFEDNSAWGQ